MDPIIKGHAYTLGEDVRDNVNTDIIIPPEHLTRFDRAYLGSHAMDGLPGMKPGAFAAQVSAGFTILVSGENFGCGSMRAHAVYALGGAGIHAILATSYARTFYRNAVNCGYLVPIIVQQDAVNGIEWRDHLELHLTTNEVRNLSTQKVYAIAPFSTVIGDIIDAGGLAEYNKRRLRVKKSQADFPP